MKSLFRRIGLTVTPLLIIFALLMACAHASPSGQSVRVLFLVTDDEGRWTSDVQEKLYPKGPSLDQKKEKEPVGVVFVPLKDALNEKTALALPPKERQSLLRFPEALLASKKAGKIFNCDYVFSVELFKPSEEWAAEGKVYRVADGQTELLDTAMGKDEKAAVDAAMVRLPQTLSLMAGDLDLPVVGSDVGRLYHGPKAEHMTAKGTRVEFKNPAQARLAGFSPCRICFPHARLYKKTDTLESALALESERYIANAYIVSTDQAQIDRVERLGRKIVQDNELTDFTYRFRVLDTDVINAYSLPGGGIYMTRGLMEILESDDELGGIIAHEISHCSRHHLVKMFRKARTNAILGTVLVVATGSMWVAAAADFANNFFVSGWSRGYEAESDRYGIIYGAASGFDPEEFVVALRKLRDLEKQNKEGPGWFRTHPTDDQRLKEADKTIADLRVIRESANEMKALDPQVGAYIAAYPFVYLEEPDLLKKFSQSFKALRLEDAPAGQFQLIPLEGASKNPDGTPSLEMAPPESIRKDK